MRHAITVFCLFLGAIAALAYPSGMPNGYAGQPPSGANCVNCHSSYPLNSGNGYLQISGLPSAGYVPGTTYPLTVTLADPGQMRWGFECTSIYQSGSSYLQAGDFTVTDPTHTTLGVGSGTSPDYMKHTSSGTYPGTPGPTSWSFNWTAPNPAVGPIGFYFSGAACNNTGGTSGDYCYTNTATSNPASSTPNVTITVLPVNPPIIIPAQGGTFEWDLTLHNGETTPQAIDIWTIITLPSGSSRPGWGPFLNLTMPAGATINRVRTQNIVDRYPPGAYTYTANIGDHPGVVWDSDSFPFSKSAAGADGWVNSQPTMALTPTEYLLHGASPNPFNPTTTLSFALPQAGPVRLSVYNVSGREVAPLVNGWRDAGNHEVTFNATGLASGLYVYQLTAGDFHASGKLMLTK
jgi:hypothetical protein